MKEYLIWLAKLLTLTLIFIFVVPALFVGVGMAVSKGAKIESASENKVAVVKLEGMILDSEEVLDTLYDFADDPSVKGIVLRINSPGGAVGPSQEIYSAVKKIKSKKPVVASMGAVAASGGLYAALGASKVYAQPGTLTGSIGVLIQFPNLTNIADQVGFKMVTIKSGQLKDIGNTFRPMTEDDRQFLQSTVDSIYQDFFQAVVDSRNLPPQKVSTFADGRIITGAQALELKLIDDHGDIYTAAREVFEILGEPLAEDERPTLYYPDDTFKEFKKFFEAVLDFPVRMSGALRHSQMEALYIM